MYMCCSRWVEGLNAARYVYQRMLEQEKAGWHYHAKEEDCRNKKMMKYIRSKKWHRQRYLPVLSSYSANEEWDNIPFPETTTTTSDACGFSTSDVFPLPPSNSSSRTSRSSGYLSDVASFHSNNALPGRALTLPHRHTPTDYGCYSPFTSDRCSTPPTQDIPDIFTPVTHCGYHIDRLASTGDSLKPKPSFTSHLASIHSSTTPAGGRSTMPSGTRSSTPAGSCSTTPAGGRSTTPAGVCSNTPVWGRSTPPSGCCSPLPSGCCSTTPAGCCSTTPAGGRSTTPRGVFVN